MEHTISYIFRRAKVVRWIGTALKDVRSFPKEARRSAGYQLYRIQRGTEPADWRPMPSVGSGVAELRIHADTEHRVFYVAKFPEAMYVLHAFEKKSEKTGQRDIDLGRQRFKELVKWRHEEKF